MAGVFGQLPRGEDFMSRRGARFGAHAVLKVVGGVVCDAALRTAAVVNDALKCRPGRRRHESLMKIPGGWEVGRQSQPD